MTPQLLQRGRLEQARSSVNPLRACEVCDHGAGAAHECRHGSRPVPAAVARSEHGHCGPEAKHQVIAGDDLQARPTWQRRLF
jgi:hypothetical protein